MTTALTPALALAYIKELSADFIAGVVLDGHGTLLAGPEALAAPARALLGAGQAAELHGATATGHAFAARTQTHAIVVATGPHALARVTRLDLRTALAALGAESAQESPPERIPHAAVATLLDAAQDPFRPHSAVSRSD